MNGSDNWYRLDPVQTGERLGTDIRRGLTRDEAERRWHQYGPNELRREEEPSLLSMFIRQFKDFLVLILLAASILSVIVGEFTDAVIIIVIVILNALLGMFQESRASKAMEALKRMSKPEVSVIREGMSQVIAATKLVPGDLVILDAGDYVPADLRIIEAANLKIDESAITGESVPVEKEAQVVFSEEKELGDRLNCAYSGTIVTYGRGKGLVTATGMDTVVGGIAEMLQTVEEEDTPLQKKLGQFGKYLGLVALAVCGIVFVLGIIRGTPFVEMFMIAVSLAVAAIPEGLPAVVAIVLALGMQRMVKQHTILKRLHAVETLGSTTVICSDKTGTMTQNEMTVVRVYTPDGRIYEVSGEGYAPEGDFHEGGKPLTEVEEGNVFALLQAVLLCNDSELVSEKERDKTVWKIMGDPTEGALVVAAAKAGLKRDVLEKSNPRVAEIPFDSERKLMSTIHRTAEGGFIVFTKGAPDVLISRCNRMYGKDGIIKTLLPGDVEEILRQNKEMAYQALRVLAAASKPLDEVPDKIQAADLEKDLIFNGLVGMIDPPRQEAAEAVKVCREAGIRVVMITGDYKETASAIAAELGIIKKDASTLAGMELERMDEGELAGVVKETSVYARVSPEHKVRIVDALKKQGEIVAMTGDGVNDAPALKRADIGIAMGITGTDVAKETADMVLTDDNFASIVAAVEEGRVIYSNIRKFVFFLLSCNVSEILIIFLAMLIGSPIPLLAIHLLLINLITDAFPALALGTEKKEPDLMKLPPRNPEEPILNAAMRRMVIIHSVVLTLAVLGSFYYALLSRDSIELARTYAFTTLILAELFRAYTARSERFTLWRLGVFSNRNLNIAAAFSLLTLVMVLAVKPIASLFDIVPLALYDVRIILPFALLPLIFSELAKKLKKDHPA